MNQLIAKPTTNTTAAQKKTSRLASTKPIRKGAVRRSSAPMRKELSEVSAPSALPDCNEERRAWLFGSANTAGSWVALESSDITVGLAKASVTVSSRRLKRMERKTATPKVPPIWRKKVAEEVATPISRAGTEFWLDTIRVCISCPRPKPTITIPAETIHKGVAASKMRKKYP